MVPIYHPKTNSYSIFDCLKMLEVFQSLSASLAADALVIAALVAVVVVVVVVVALVAVVVASLCRNYHCCC